MTMRDSLSRSKIKCRHYKCFRESFKRDFCEQTNGWMREKLYENHTKRESVFDSDVTNKNPLFKKYMISQSNLFFEKGKIKVKSFSVSD